MRESDRERGRERDRGTTTIMEGKTMERRRDKMKR